MKNFVAAIMLVLVPTLTTADDSVVKFSVTVKQDGRLIASPSFLAAVGKPASIRLDGLTVEGLAKPFEADGRGWTQIRITYFETEDSKFVQEMQMRHKYSLRTGTFEYTDPAGRRYVVQIGE